jgi:hypothetical protein
VVLIDLKGRDRHRRGTVFVKNGYVNSVAFGRRGELIALGCDRGAAGRMLGRKLGGGTVAIAETREVALRPEPIQIPEGDVRGVAFDPEGGLIAGGYGDGRGGGGVALLDAGTGARARTLALQPGEGDVTAVAFSPAGGLVAAGYGRRDGGGGVAVFDARTGARVQTLAIQPAEGIVTSVAFGPRNTLAAGFVGGVAIFDAGTGTRSRTLAIEPSEVGVTGVAFGLKDALAASHWSGVALFDARTGARTGILAVDAAEGDVWGVAFCPDGDLIAAGYGRRGSNGGVAVFDTRTGSRLWPRPLRIAEGEVKGLSFGPKHLLAAGFKVGDRTADVTGPRAGAYADSTRPIRINVGFTGGMVLLDADPGTWVSQAGHVANRNFTYAEWTQYFPALHYRRTIRSLPWPHDLPDVERSRAVSIEGLRTGEELGP